MDGRYYSEGKKRVADVMPIATGHEREELEAELEGRNVLEMNYPVGPFGTKRTISAIDIQRIAKELGQSFIDKEIQEIIEEADRDRKFASFYYDLHYSYVVCFRYLFEPPDTLYFRIVLLVPLSNLFSLFYAICIRC